MRLIDADAWLRETHFREGVYPHEMLKKEIEAQLAIEAEPVKHGRWEKRTDIPGIVCCSNCKDCNLFAEYVNDVKWNYCPHCGARMDGKE